MEEIIGRWAGNRPSVSISEVLEECLQKLQGLWRHSDKNRGAVCRRFLGWERYRDRLFLVATLNDGYSMPITHYNPQRQPWA